MWCYLATTDDTYILIYVTKRCCLNTDLGCEKCLLGRYLVMTCQLDWCYNGKDVLTYKDCVLMCDVTVKCYTMLTWSYWKMTYLLNATDDVPIRNTWIAVCKDVPDEIPCWYLAATCIDPCVMMLKDVPTERWVLLLTYALSLHTCIDDTDGLVIGPLT